jgi:DNA polymerase-3 subunit delta'
LGVTGRTGSAPRGTGGALKELEQRQASRAKRVARDSLDGALADLAALYRDVLRVQVGAPLDPVHPDQTRLVADLAAGTRPEATVHRIEAVLAAREAVAGNVAPLLAVEAMALELR